MSDTRIIYKNNKGFWIDEAFMQLVFYYIFNEINKPQYNVTDKPNLLEYMSICINGYVSPSLGWVSHLTTKTEEQTMIQVLQNVKTTLQNKGAFISIQEQKTIQTEDHTLEYMLGKKPFPTTELIKVIDALIQMLQGTWESTNYNMDLNWRLYE